MEYRIIPMETYPRRAHFAYFSTMAQPYAGVTVSVEITHFLESVQEKGSPFFLSFLYCVSGRQSSSRASAANLEG